MYTLVLSRYFVNVIYCFSKEIEHHRYTLLQLKRTKYRCHKSHEYLKMRALNWRSRCYLSNWCVSCHRSGRKVSAVSSVTWRFATNQRSALTMTRRTAVQQVARDQAKELMSVTFVARSYRICIICDVTWAQHMHLVTSGHSSVTSARVFSITREISQCTWSEFISSSSIQVVWHRQRLEVSSFDVAGDWKCVSFDVPREQKCLLFDVARGGIFTGQTSPCYDVLNMLCIALWWPDSVCECLLHGRVFMHYI